MSGSLHAPSATELPLSHAGTAAGPSDSPELAGLARAVERRAWLHRRPSVAELPRWLGAWWWHLAVEADGRLAAPTKLWLGLIVAAGAVGWWPAPVAAAALPVIVTGARAAEAMVRSRLAKPWPAPWSRAERGAVAGAALAAWVLGVNGRPLAGILALLTTFAWACWSARRRQDRGER